MFILLKVKVYNILVCVTSCRGQQELQLIQGQLSTLILYTDKTWRDHIRSTSSLALLGVNTVVFI